MAELAENTIEVYLKIGGVSYAMGLSLKDFATEKMLRRGLAAVNRCLLETLREQGYWLSDG